MNKDNILGINIYEDDDTDLIAQKIFFRLQIGQSVKANKDIWNRLAWYDMVINTKGGRRIQITPPRCIGGPVAHKMFKFSKDESTIWRIQ